MSVKKLSGEEKYIFTNEMEIILSSGLHIMEGLEMMSHENTSERLQAVSLSLMHDMQQGTTFYDAICKVECFDGYMEEMVHIGEGSGKLDRVMKELSLYYDRMNEMQRRIKEAISYPLVLIVMMTIIMGLMVYKVVPIFKSVLLNVEMDLSSSSAIMMHIGETFAYVSFIILLILTIAIVVFSLYAKMSKDKKRVETFLMRFLLTRKLYEEMSMAQLTFALSLFLSSGYPIEEALGYLPDFITHPKLHKKVICVLKDVKQGKAFIDAVNENHIYKGIYANMLSVAMKTGQQDDVLKNLVVQYEKNVEEATSHFLNIIEPTIIALLSVMVGIILLSIMLPLMGIMGSIG